jgi:TPP-dependent pyruvate/acetoin dehydrogenase alpha subunit
MFEYWRKRDPIARFENYLLNTRKWLTKEENAKLISDLERLLEEEREVAVNSPMPTPESAAGGVYCEPGCHDIEPKYSAPKSKARKSVAIPRGEATVHLR